MGLRCSAVWRFTGVLDFRFSRHLSCYRLRLITLAVVSHCVHAEHDSHRDHAFVLDVFAPTNWCQPSTQWGL